MEKRQRPIQIHFMVNQAEQQAIYRNMADAGILNMSAYLRNMALHGQIVHVDTSDVKEMVRLLGYAGNNLNQLARKAHETGNIYHPDLVAIQQKMNQIWNQSEEILQRVSAL